MKFRAKETHTFAYRHVLLYIQVLSFLVLFLSGHVAQALIQAAYCVVVFTSPLLLLVYGARYAREQAWSWAVVPFLAEALLSVLFVGAMIYGIWCNASGGILFIKLLAVYTADAALCVLGCFGILKI